MSLWQTRNWSILKTMVFGHTPSTFSEDFTRLYYFYFIVNLSYFRIINIFLPIIPSFTHDPSRSDVRKRRKWNKTPIRKVDVVYEIIKCEFIIS